MVWLANDERPEAAGFELKYIPRNVTIMLTLVIMQFGMWLPSNELCRL
jgi:hypothetical protein